MRFFRRARTIPRPTGAVVTDAVAAFRDSASVGLGLVPLGLAFGVIITHAGLAWWWSSIFTSTVYAGSLEFVLIGLVTALAPLATIATTAFLVNVRHVFYALSFPLHRVKGRGARIYSTFALTDEVYALATAEGNRHWPGRRIVFLQVFLQIYWVGGATSGALLGSVVPAGVDGLDFAMTALFAVLALEALRNWREDLPTPVLALLGALAARLLFPGQMLLAAFTMFTVALMARCRASGRRAADADA